MRPPKTVQNVQVLDPSWTLEELGSPGSASFPPAARFLNRRGYSLNSWWTNEIAIEPSPTADATRLTLPPRTSPAAKTPGRLVSSRYGRRAGGQCAVLRSSGYRSGPVLTVRRSRGGRFVGVSS